MTGKRRSHRFIEVDRVPRHHNQSGQYEPAIPEDEVESPWKDLCESSREIRFVQRFCQHYNGTRAVQEAGYDTDYPGHLAYQLRIKPRIQQAIEACEKEVLAKLDVTPERILAEYARIGFSDIGDFTAWGPNGVAIIDSGELPEGASRVVSEVSETITNNGRSVKFRLHDKKAALDSLAKAHGMFIEKHELSGPDGGPIGLDVLVREAINGNNTNPGGKP